jgi:hypothetical protein
MNLVNWPLQNSKEFVLMITSLLLERKDEVVIRQTCSIMIDLIFSSLMTEPQLKNFVETKKIANVFFKMISKVSTFYTQKKLLEVTYKILNMLGEAVFKKEFTLLVSQQMLYKNILINVILLLISDGS